MHVNVRNYLALRLCRNTELTPALSAAPLIRFACFWLST